MPAWITGPFPGGLVQRMHVVDYTREAEWSRSVLESTGGTGVDHIIETGGAGTLDQSIKARAVGGTISLLAH
jgi:NADPH:quinone reductase-like Zn-dependent oxidoreductase